MTDYFSSSNIGIGLPYTYKTTRCPQCKETVTVPADTIYARYTSHGKKLFCSYHCVRAWDKAHPRKRRL